MAKHENYMKCVLHENHIKASNQNKERSLKLKNKRIEDYNLHPVNCKNCNCVLDYEKRMNIFCNKSCSTTYNNMNRTRKRYIIGTEHIIARKQKNEEIYNQTPKQCQICQNVIEYAKRKRKFCSNTCKNLFHSQIAKTKSKLGGNKNRKACWYDSKFAGKVWLESSYEVVVAKSLDYHNIKWIRPGYIIWIDIDKKSHKYYPDFYLVDYDIYLDPKNDFLQQQDKVKIDSVQQQNNIKVIILNKFQLEWDVIKTLI